MKASKKASQRNWKQSLWSGVNEIYEMNKAEETKRKWNNFYAGEREEIYEWNESMNEMSKWWQRRQRAARVAAGMNSEI